MTNELNPRVGAEKMLETIPSRITAAIINKNDFSNLTANKVIPCLAQSLVQLVHPKLLVKAWHYDG
jgi:hypothetical protein